MSISFDMITGAFLSKITEYDLMMVPHDDREEIVAGYRTRAVSQFRHVTGINFAECADEENARYDIDVSDDDADELVDIISEGMIVQWLKPYIFQQELLETVLNTRDYTTYSPANILFRVRETYKHAQSDFTQAIREYSYNHGDLTVLHL